MSGGRVTVEEVPGLYTGSGLRTNAESRSVLLQMRCGNTFYGHLTAVIRAIHAAGSYSRLLHNI